MKMKHGMSFYYGSDFFAVSSLSYFFFFTNVMLFFLLLEIHFECVENIRFNISWYFRPNDYTVIHAM